MTTVIDNSNKEKENIRTYQIKIIEMRNTVIELKNKLVRFSRRLHDVAEWIGNLDYRKVELSESEQQKEKEFKKK